MKSGDRRDIRKIVGERIPIDAALARAVTEALEEHRRAGHPVAEWRDGALVWVAPEDIPPADHPKVPWAWD